MFNLCVWRAGKEGDGIDYEEILIGSSYIDGGIALQRAYSFAKRVEKWRNE
jgi:hypothetical protein